MGFPERLKELRESRGLSQEAFADTLGIPRSSITHYEKPDQGEKERLPRRERLEKIADFFGVSVDYLLDRTDDQSPSLKKEKPLSEFENLFFNELNKLSEEDKKKALEHVKYLRFLAEQENNRR